MISLLVLACASSYGVESQFKSSKSIGEQFRKIALSKVNDKSGAENVPDFAKNYSPDEHAPYPEGARAVVESHDQRDLHTFDEHDDVLERSDTIQKDPDKYMEESGELRTASDGSTYEYCESCTGVPYTGTGRKVKRRYVYLDKPPYITAEKRCKNHGLLSVKVELLNEPEEVFRDDGQFLNLRHVSTTNSGGSYIDEVYNVNGANITLRKTVMQEGIPWIRPGCYLVPSLQGNVVNSGILITKLLGGDKDEDLSWGEIGTAHLNHRVVNDTEEHYWILDGNCMHYEELCDQGTCEYLSMTEDPETYKYWKGKKVWGSWGQTVTYRCVSRCKDTCAALRGRGCQAVDKTCTSQKDGKCLKWKWRYKCPGTKGGKNYKYPGKTAFCLSGDCVDSSFEADKDISQVMGYLSILEAARKELDGRSVQIFKGNALGCNRFILSFKDCCGCGGGWGVSMGLSSCGSEASTLAKLRKEGKCVKVGTYCAKKTPLLGVCIRKKTKYCCFGSKFGKLLQEQGRKQLEMDFGSAKHPNCRGFTAEELSRIDFSRLDLTEIIDDVMQKFNASKGKHFASGDELKKIRAHLPDTTPPNAKHVQQSIQKNIKHMLSNVK